MALVALVALVAVSAGGRVRRCPVPGQGEEHVVEARQAQRQLGDLDASVLQDPHHRGHGIPVDDRGRNPSLPAVDHRVGAQRPGHELHGIGQAVRPGHPYLQRLTTQPSLELLWSPSCDDRACVDDDDLVGEVVGLLQVLRGEQHRGPVGGEGADHAPGVAPSRGVQTRRRFVEEHHRRSADQARGEVQPAAHAAGVRPDCPVGRVVQPGVLDELLRPCGRPPPRQAEEPPDHAEVLPAGQVGVDGGVLTG